MKTELEKFIHQETKAELKQHHLFLTQLFMLSKETEKENNGSPLTVFQVLLRYIMEITNRNDTNLNEYMDTVNKRLDQSFPEK
jgi:hypothetical protein